MNETYNLYKKHYVDLEKIKGGECKQLTSPFIPCDVKNKFYDNESGKCCETQNCCDNQKCQPPHCYYNLPEVAFKFTKCSDSGKQSILNETSQIQLLYTKIKTINGNEIEVPHSIKIKNKDISYMFVGAQCVGEGAYGYVVVYRELENKTRGIALKIAKRANGINDDIKVANILINSGCQHLAIKSIVIEETKSHFPNCIIMDAVDGSLIELIPQLYKKDKESTQLIMNILKQITLGLKCLFENNYAYTDIKPANILYSCIDTNNIKVILGDIGSAIEMGKSDKAIATYCPYDKKDQNGILTNPEESDIAWGIGVLLLALMKEDISFLSFRNIEFLEYSSITYILNKYKTEVIYPILERTLTETKQTRAKMSDVFALINTILAQLV